MTAQLSALMVILVWLTKFRVTNGADELLEVNGLEFGKPESYWSNDVNINCMQEDELISGNLLLSTPQGLYSLTPERELISVATREDMAREGISSISSFVQHNISSLIVVDDVNNCLHWLHRNTSQGSSPSFSVSTLTGKCGSEGNGTNGNFDVARLNLPDYITRGHTKNHYFLSEPFTDDGIIKMINFNNNRVDLMLGGDKVHPENGWSQLNAIIYIPQLYTLYISTYANIYAIDFKNFQPRPLVAGESGKTDGALAEAEFTSTRAFAAIEGKILITLPTFGPYLRIVDLQMEYVFSLDLPTDKRFSCILAVPSEQRIYLGGLDGLWAIPYQVKHTQPNRGWRVVLSPLLMFIVALLI